MAVGKQHSGRQLSPWRAAACSRPDQNTSESWRATRDATPGGGPDEGPRIRVALCLSTGTLSSSQPSKSSELWRQNP